MITSSGFSRTIGLHLSQTDLYPPLLGTGPAVIGIITALPPGEAVEFSLVVNGVPGVPPGIELRTSSGAGGTLWVNPGFINLHPDTWPVQVTVQASRNGVIAEDATMWLHDTRNMQIHRVEANLLPNPIHTSDVEPITVRSIARFYDRAGLELPRDEVPWRVALPDHPPGLEVDGASIHIEPGTAAGEIRVLIDEPSGVSQLLSLVVLPPLDIDFELSSYDVYPPVRETLPETVSFRTSLPPEVELVFDYQLNGDDGRHEGLYLQAVGPYWALWIDQQFLRHYDGPWPAIVTLQVWLEGQLAGHQTLKLHDTRTMVCTRVELVYIPSEVIDIPASETAQLIAAPRFYDAQDILLPHSELDWDARLENEPHPGIERYKHLLFIDPQAAPGQYVMTILGPNDLSRSKFFTLR